MITLLRFLPARAGAALAASLVAVAAGPVLAASPVLRSVVVVQGEVVTVGDFFVSPGPLAAVPLFRAPDLGKTGVLPAARVVEAARAVGLGEVEAEAVHEVTVTREARTVTSDDLTALIRSAVAVQGKIDAPETLLVTFDQMPEPFAVEMAPGDPARLAGLSWVAATGRFEALVEVDAGARPKRLRFRGQAIETVEVVQLNRPLARGEVIAKDDLVVERVPRRSLVGTVGGRAEAYVGLEARRALRAGQPLLMSDLMAPQLVKRGDTVTIVYEAPGLMLTVRGQALDAGAHGEQLAILNLQSKRVVQAIVVAAGKVSVGPTPIRVADHGRVQ